MAIMQSNMHPDKKSLNIAVIGTGVAGMSAAWLLNKKHSITVFEQHDRTGGHINTVDASMDNFTHPVDTGFIVYNEKNYPNFVALLKHLNVKTQPTTMSFSVSLNRGDFEFGSSNINTFFGQRPNLIKSDFWKMLMDIRKFFRDAEEFRTKSKEISLITLGNFLSQGGYGKPFIEKFILPMGAAIWSSKPEDIRNQPAISFINFFSSHGLLQFINPVKWRTIVGGSREYTNKLTAEYSPQINLGQRIKSITRNDRSVVLADKNGVQHSFDHVVIATHADEALTMLADANRDEQSLLEKFKYNNSRVILHSDESLMPKRKLVWSSWNFLGSTKYGVSVTYWMNLLQSINQNYPYFVSVNPQNNPKDKLIHGIFQYQHPNFDKKAWTAQQNLWHLQGKRNTWFCGSYFGYGFHEDAVQAGLAVAEQLGGMKRPWKTKEHSSRIFRLSD